MISLIISIFLGALSAYGYSFLKGSSWGITIMFIFVGTVAFLMITRMLMKKMSVQINAMQQFLINGQKQLQRQAQQMRSVGSQKAVMEKQKKMVEDSLAILGGIERFYPWTLFAKKQIHTIKFQLYYQVQSFNKAKKYANDVMLFQAPLIAMKMAFLYKISQKDESFNFEKVIGKVFAKGIWKIRNPFEKSFLYNVYAWILVKKGMLQQAINLLLKAKNKNKVKDSTLISNLEKLQNGKENQLSNNAFGDVWYNLFLQEMPKAKMKMVRK